MKEIIIGLDIINVLTREKKVWFAKQDIICDFNKLADENGNKGKPTYKIGNMGKSGHKDVFIRKGYT